MPEKSPDRVPPVAAMLAGEFGEKEFGFTGGAMLPTPEPRASAQISQTLRDRAAWTGPPELAARPADPPRDPSNTLSALDQMRIADSTDDDWPVPGPPMVTPPLRRPEIPAVDWRHEETLRAEEHLHRLEAKSLQVRHS